MHDALQTLRSHAGCHHAGHGKSFSRYCAYIACCLINLFNCTLLVANGVALTANGGVGRVSNIELAALLPAAMESQRAIDLTNLHLMLTSNLRESLFHKCLQCDCGWCMICARRPLSSHPSLSSVSSSASLNSHRNYVHHQPHCSVFGGQLSSFFRGFGPMNFQKRLLQRCVCRNQFATPLLLTNPAGAWAEPLLDTEGTATE
jgi:hypothetical protein